MVPIRVALIEDEAPFAQAIATLLGMTPGFEWVATCPTIAAAREKLSVARPQVALVDLDLPDGTGVECIRELRQFSPATKPIVLSKFADSERIFDAIVAGALGYVHKFDGGREILDAIEAVHGGAGAMSPTIARRAFELLRDQGRPGTGNDEPLTPREEEVLQWAVQGFDTKGIAERVSMSPFTVSNHLTRIYRKLHVARRTELPGYRKRTGPD